MKHLVVIGNGPAAIAAIEQIQKFSPALEITAFADQADHDPNAGLEWYQDHRVGLNLGVRVTDLDVDGRTLTKDDGGITEWDKLILATGKSPRVPVLPGVDQPGVLIYRGERDDPALLSAERTKRRAVVLGGGVRGLQAASLLFETGWNVTVVQSALTLLNRYLDVAGGAVVESRLRRLGLAVLTERTTRKIVENPDGLGVRLDNGEMLDAGLVVIAAGLRPNAALAGRAGLETCRGILVNAHMECSRPDVYAIGDCVEFRGEPPGACAPLSGQAAALAASLTGNRGPVCIPASDLMRYSFLGLGVASGGELDATTASGAEIVRLEDTALGIYKKLTLRDQRLTGAILTGDLSDYEIYREWLRSGTGLSSWRARLLNPEARPRETLIPATVD